MASAVTEDGRRRAEGMAITLAVVGIGIGLAEYFAPRRVARLVGVREPDARSDRIIRDLATRELSRGLAILGRPGHPAGLWARVGGDLVDLYTLGKMGRSYELNRAVAATAAAMLIGAAAFDLFVARRLQHARHGAAPGGGRGRTSDGDFTGARALTDHDQIRQWAESRRARPACVKGTGDEDDVGMIRLDFPGFSGGDSLQEISWDEWFAQFDENGLALLVQERTASGETSNFNKLVKRETADRG